MPFLEVLTRTNGRPTMLERNRAGLMAQTDGDWTQTFLVDEIGRGVAWANQNLGRYAPNLVGDYIWVVDDDDECICPGFVAGLKTIVHKTACDVVMVRVDHGPSLGVMPRGRYWGSTPALTHIGFPAFVVRRALWQACADSLAPKRLGADYYLIRAIWDRAPRVAWWDVVASRVQRISRGLRGDGAPAPIKDEGGQVAPTGEMPPTSLDNTLEAIHDYSECGQRTCLIRERAVCAAGDQPAG